MKAGSLNRRVEILKPPAGVLRTAYGDIPQTEYTAEATVWAEVRDLTANELLRAQQVQSDATSLVRIRFRKDITFQHRLRVIGDGSFHSRTRTFEIVGQPQDSAGDSREMQFFCKEVAEEVRT